MNKLGHREKQVGNVPWKQTLSSVIPPHIHIFFLDWYNRKGHKCRTHENTAPGDNGEQPYKALFLGESESNVDKKNARSYVSSNDLILQKRRLKSLFVVVWASYFCKNCSHLKNFKLIKSSKSKLTKKTNTKEFVNKKLSW